LNQCVCTRSVVLCLRRGYVWAVPFAVGPEQQSVLQVNRSPLLGSRGLAPALRHQPSGSNLKVAASSFGQYVSQMSFTRSDPGVRLVLAGPDLRGRRAGRTTTRRRQPPRAFRPRPLGLEPQCRWIARASGGTRSSGRPLRPQGMTTADVDIDGSEEVVLARSRVSKSSGADKSPS
jgi:hypothetical protein